MVVQFIWTLMFTFVTINPITTPCDVITQNQLTLMIKNKIIHSSQLFMLKQIIYLLILLYALFSELDNPEQSRYIPRSKRWTRGRRIGSYFLKQGTRLWKHCEDCLNRSSTHNEARRGKIKQLRMAFYKIKSQDDLCYHRRRWSTKLTGLLAFNAVAMQAATDLRKEHSATFDTDSGLIGVDNRC